MKEYKVAVLKSDNYYKVRAAWSTGRDDDTTGQVDMFSNEKEAIEHAQWWTNESGRKDEIDSVEVAHIIRLVCSK